MVSNQRKLTPEALYQQIANLISQMPNFREARYPLSREDLLWLGRAQAIIEFINNTPQVLSFRVASENIAKGRDLRTFAAQMEAILYTALAMAELNAPASVAGGYIPANSPLDAMQSVGKILSNAKEHIRFVDPYAEEKLLFDFALQAAEGVAIEVLADLGKQKPALKPAADRWRSQFGGIRPLEVRGAAPGTLHDRLIFVDSASVWTVGQSFNALAARSPTSILRIDPETAQLKRDAYNAVWQNASAL